MHIYPRYLKNAILEAFSQKKMVFLGGARQVGKTTFALSFLSKRATAKHPAYFNWDVPDLRRKWLRMEFPIGEKQFIFDEVHKYARWRNFVKGIYDIEGREKNILVTGSARLDYYRKGGDSLANRYRYFRLHPFTLLEWKKAPTSKDLAFLLDRGGFPEPLFQKTKRAWRIWRRDRISRIVREDLRDLERVREISLIEQLVELLPEKVGAPLSIKSIREDLQVDHKTVSKWIQILENLYLCYRIPPYGPPRVRAVKKENKLYLWDWSRVEDRGFRFENLVASHLLKYCHFLEDTEGYRMELRFLRDTDKREIDFVVLKDKKPLFALECKSGERPISPSILYFQKRTNIPRFFQVHLGKKKFQKGNCFLMPFVDFCKFLKIP